MSPFLKNSSARARPTPAHSSSHGSQRQSPEGAGKERDNGTWVMAVSQWPAGPQRVQANGGPTACHNARHASHRSLMARVPGKHTLHTAWHAHGEPERPSLRMNSGTHDRQHP